MKNVSNVPSFDPSKQQVPPSAIIESKKTHAQPKSDDEKLRLEGFNQAMPKADKYSEERISDAIADRAVEAGVVDSSVMPG